MGCKSSERESSKISKNRRGIADESHTMPLMYINRFRVIRTWFEDRIYHSKVNYIHGGMPPCRACSSKGAAFYDYYRRRARFVNREGLVRVLHIKAKRFKCPHCGSVFREPIEGLKPRKQSSENYRARIASTHLKGVSNKQISVDTGVSQSTVERIVHEQWNLKVKEQLSYECPSVLGIDEHTIHKGYKFATTICDLSNHRVYDVLEGRKHADLEVKLMSYRGRENVKVVCMDLSATYRNVVRKCFPNAKILADRFHVVRLVLYHFMEFCKAANAEVKWNRGLTHALRTHGMNLKVAQRDRLKSFLENNPAIEVCYEFKERLCGLLNRKTQTARDCRSNIKELKAMMKQMKYESTVEFVKLANTISDWFAPIIRMWRYTKNNGITEGFHRKMKLIQRQAYGYRNFQNYRLRVLVLCGIKPVFHSFWC